jgi:hypothetical protein
MLIYGLYVAALVLIVVAAWFAWHRLRGGSPPVVEADDKGPPPSDRDEQWDPRRRYDPQEGPS